MRENFIGSIISKLKQRAEEKIATNLYLNFSYKMIYPLYRRIENVREKLDEKIKEKLNEETD
jgi:hypothetical protein